LRNESLDGGSDLEAPEVIAAEIIEDLQTALDKTSRQAAAVPRACGAVW
jgi:hypothetical protein